MLLFQADKFKTILNNKKSNIKYGNKNLSNKIKSQTDLQLKGNLKVFKST